MSPEEVLRIVTWIEIIIKVACIVGGIVLACIFTLPALIKAIKQRKAAKTAEEKAIADAAIREKLQELVVETEVNYKGLSTALSRVGQKAGSYKKDKVLSDLRDYCDENGYEFNKAESSKDIDKFVEIANSVNAN